MTSEKTKTLDDLRAELTETKQALELLRKEKAPPTGVADMGSLADFMEQVSDPVYLKDPNGCYLMANKSCCKLFGQMATSVIGLTDFDFLPRIEAEVLREHDLKSLNQQSKGKHHSLDPVRQQGRAHYRSCSFSTARTVYVDGQGELVGVLGIARDITSTFDRLDEISRKEKAYKKILHLLELQRFALDQHSIVAITDPSGVITYVNEKFCEISGYSRSEIIGKTHKILNSGEQPASFFGDLWSEIAQGNVWQGEICNRAKDGSLYWVDTTIVPFRNSTGEILEYVAIRTDITDKKHLAKRSEERRQELNRAQRMVSLGTLAAGVAHEISQPLNALKVIVDGMEYRFRDGWDFDESVVRKKLRTVSAQSSRIEDIIKHMRLLYQDQGTKTLSLVDVNNTVSQALNLVRAQTASHGIDLQVILDEKLPKTKSHAIQLEQVIINLVVNARQALDEVQSSDKWLRIETKLFSGGLRLIVSDNGPGLGAAIEQIFDPFYSSKKKLSDGGMGIGLSLVQSFVHSWGGTICAQDRKGGGAEFIIDLKKGSR